VLGLSAPLGYFVGTPAAFSIFPRTTSIHRLGKRVTSCGRSSPSRIFLSAKSALLFFCDFIINK